jgi:hypothetical protein
MSREGSSIGERVDIRFGMLHSGSIRFDRYGLAFGRGMRYPMREDMKG